MVKETDDSLSLMQHYIFNGRKVHRKVVDSKYMIITYCKAVIRRTQNQFKVLEMILVAGLSPTIKI